MGTKTLTETQTTNSFLEAVSHLTTSLTDNGAGAYTTVGTVLSSQFGEAGTYRNRDIQNVFQDQAELWNENPDAALRFPFYLRLITRKAKINKDNMTDSVQTGQGQRDEAFKRLLWIAVNHKDIFEKNIWLLPIVGSWKDVWTLMFYDKKHELNAINHQFMYELIRNGLLSPQHINLVKKFMPRIKSNKRCTTEWTKITNELAKGLAKYFKINIASYNSIKSTGTAHDFQKFICSQQYDKLNWAQIPGKALNLLVNGKFLENHQLDDSYLDFVKDQPTVKFTGFAYELAKQVRQSHRMLKEYQKFTIDKQFEELVKRAKANDKITDKVWCAIDSSGSMTCGSCNTGNVTPYDVATGLGIFFSTLNEGAFHKNVIMFDDISHVHQLNGTFTEMMSQIRPNAMGGTNFQSIIEEIIRIRKERPDVPLEDYPTTLLVVSDMQFNGEARTTYNWRTRTWEKIAPPTYETSKAKLLEVFPEEWVNEFKFVWWNCNARVSGTFPSNLKDEQCFYFSGFDGSVINLLLGEEVTKVEKKKMTQEELVQKALSQEILNYLVLG